MCHDALCYEIKRNNSRYLLLSETHNKGCSQSCTRGKKISIPPEETNFHRVSYVCFKTERKLKIAEPNSREFCQILQDIAANKDRLQCCHFCDWHTKSLQRKPDLKLHPHSSFSRPCDATVPQDYTDS